MEDADATRPPVKAEFARAAWPSAAPLPCEQPPPGAAATGGAPADEPSAPAEAAAAAPAKSKRAAARERHAGRGAAKLCTSFQAGRCTWGDRCRFSHDEGAFRAAKPADLPGRCPFASAPAGCPFGVACRFEGAHGTAAPPPDDGGGGGAARRPLLAHVEDEPPPPERNAVPAALLASLRRGDVPFPAADARLRKLGYKISVRQGQQPTEVGAAGAGERGAAEAEAEAEEACAGGDAAEDGAGAEPGDGAAAGPSKRARTEASLSAPTPREARPLDLARKLYLAPLTTVGNLPFRALCCGLGAEVTCGEMALATGLLQGRASEWALLRRHASEACFGLQLCGGFPDAVGRTCELLAGDGSGLAFDFVDLNAGCPIDLVCGRGAGAALLQRQGKLEQVLRAAAPLLRGVPLTLKTRTGWADGPQGRVAHDLAPRLKGWGVAALTLHGRSRAQRYARSADWDYVAQVAAAAAPSGLQVVGNGDVVSFEDWERHCGVWGTDGPPAGCGVATCLVARGALVKPWLFTEVRERRHWDISAPERLDLLRAFVRLGLAHWGSDGRGVESTRRFLLEWLSFAHRYIPVGLLERLPGQHLGWRVGAAPFEGRSDLETLLGSPAPADWVRLSVMLLGPTPPGFVFAAKHKAGASEAADAFNG